MLKSHAHKLYITEVKGKNEMVQFIMRCDAPIRVENIPKLLKAYDGKMTFDPKGTPAFRLKYKKCGVIEKDEEILLSLTEQALARMEELLLEDSKKQENK